jgi:hypothetical protein
MSDHRRARILIPDNTPLSLLAMVGRDALDWLFVPGAEVWVTDMVRHEALRDPGPGDGPRKEHRQALQDWFTDNAHRLRIEVTSEGRDYERAMRNWIRAGRVPEDRPSWTDRGERSMRQALAVTRNLIENGESVLLLVDDRAARALLAQAAQTEGLNADLMATETFLALLEQDFGVAAAGAAWQAIHIAASGNEPAAPEPDPIHIRAW